MGSIGLMSNARARGLVWVGVMTKHSVSECHNPPRRNASLSAAPFISSKLDKEISEWIWARVAVPGLFSLVPLV